MASTMSIMKAIANRRTIYTLGPQSPISDDRIMEILSHVVRNGPSPFNIQSGRVVVLMKDEHQKLWDAAKAVVEANMPPHAVEAMTPKIAGFRNGYGTILWYEAQEPIRKAQEEKKSMAHLLPTWSEHSTGMLQYATWCALEAEGLGCNLQHLEGLEEHLSSEYKISGDWKLKAQMVFGQPTQGPKEKTVQPLEERLFVHGK